MDLKPLIYALSVSDGKNFHDTLHRKYRQHQNRSLSWKHSAGKIGYDLPAFALLIKPGRGLRRRAYFTGRSGKKTLADTLIITKER